MAAEDWMLIGQLAGPFGVRGEVKVELFTDFPERFAALERVYLGADRHAWEVEGSRRHKGQVLLKLRGLESPEAVRALGHPEIFVPRTQAAPLPEGHFYLEDAIGMVVVTEDGESLGPITQVLRTGSNDVFVVGRGRDEVLVPVIKDAIRELDVEGRRVTVERWALGEGE